MVEIRLEMMRWNRAPTFALLDDDDDDDDVWRMVSLSSSFALLGRRTPFLFFPRRRVAEEEAFGHNGRDVGSRIVSNRSASKRLAGKREWDLRARGGNAKRRSRREKTTNRKPESDDDGLDATMTLRSKEGAFFFVLDQVFYGWLRGKTKNVFSVLVWSFFLSFSLSFFLSFFPLY